MSHTSPLPPPPAARSGLSTSAVVVVAGAGVLGALIPAPVPRLVAVGALGLCLVRGWAAGAVLCAVAAVSGLSMAAHGGLEPPPSGPVEGVVVLRTDPERRGPIVTADAAWGDRRVELVAAAGRGDRLARAAVGDRVELVGRLRAPRPSDLSWFRPRHVAARLEIDVLGARTPAPAPISWANGVRRLLERGLGHLDPDQRALALGLAVGDDREQSPEVKDRFRAAGLGHLLAVSGSNVAFVLAMAGPFVVRLGPRGRLVATLAVLAFFAAMTRWEPSVLRATVMAAVATVGVVTGQPVEGARRLGWAVLALLLIDPLLVHSLGFVLSVSASAGILAVARPLQSWLVGPSWLREPLAVTLAAQLGVAPVAAWWLDGTPTGGVVANLLAGPAAGPAMVWVLTAGLVAGLVGGPVAQAAHLPTQLLVGWIDACARLGAGLPLPWLGRAASAISVGVVVAGLVVRSIRHRRAPDRAS